MARVLLLAPPYLDLYGKLSDAAGRYFPLGLAYIASWLRDRCGHEVQLYEPEAQGLGYEEIGRRAREFRPDVVGLTCSTPNFYRAIELARLCREVVPSARVVMGGVHASAMAEHILTEHGDLIDAVVIGEGEFTMAELVEAWAQEGDLAQVRGIAWKDGGVATRNQLRPFIEDLDQLPYPARDLIPQHLFVPNSHNARHRACATILTSRGCPYDCTFCAARVVSGRKYRMHSPEYVLAEMELLKRDYGVRQLLITDDTFTLNKKRLVAICEGMIERRLDLQWFCFSQVNTVNRELLALMKRAGCYNIGFGVEAADPATLKRMGKNIKPERAVEAVREARSLGIKTQAFYVMGSPGETLDQMRDTARFAREVGATLAFFNMLVPYPGTNDYEHFFGDRDPRTIDWTDFVAVGERCVIDSAEGVSAQDIERLIARANLRYYAHPGRLAQMAWHIRTPYELRNYARGGLSFVRQIGSWARERTRD